MTNKSQHKYIITALIFVVLILLWLIMAKTKSKILPLQNNDAIIENLIIRLKEKNNVFQEQIVELENKNVHHQLTIDSLVIKKNKIEYVYLYKIKYIDTLKPIEQVEEFKKLFYQNTIK